MALPAFAAARRAAARLLRTTGHAAINQYLLAAAAGLTAANPQQLRGAAGKDHGILSDGQTDGRKQDSFRDPARHTVRAVLMSSLSDLPDASDGVSGQLELAGVDEAQQLEHAGGRVLRQVDADHLAGRELGELAQQVLAVRRQRYLHARKHALN